MRILCLFDRGNETVLCFRKQKYENNIKKTCLVTCFQKPFLETFPEIGCLKCCFSVFTFSKMQAFE